MLTLVLVTAVGLAAVAATLYWTPAPKMRGYLQHFTAGVVLAVISVEVMPEISRRGRAAWLVFAGFALGGAGLVLLKWWTEREQAKETGSALVRGLVVASGLDNIVDGITIGAGFAAGGHLGHVLALTLGLEVIFLSLTVGGAMRSRRASRLRTAAVNGGLVCLVAVGAAAGFSVLHGASNSVIAAVLAFGAAALVYLVSEELLVEAHRTAEVPSSAALLFLGFLVIFTFHVLTHG